MLQKSRMYRIQKSLAPIQSSFASSFYTFSMTWETASLWVSHRCLKPKRFRNQLFTFYPNHVLFLNSLVNGMSILPVPLARQPRSFSDLYSPFIIVNWLSGSLEHIALKFCNLFLFLLPLFMLVSIFSYLDIFNIFLTGLCLSVLLSTSNLFYIFSGMFYKMKVCLKFNVALHCTQNEVWITYESYMVLHGLILPPSLVFIYWQLLSPPALLCSPSTNICIAILCLGPVMTKWATHVSIFTGALTPSPLFYSGTLFQQLPPLLPAASVSFPCTGSFPAAFNYVVIFFHLKKNLFLIPCFMLIVAFFLCSFVLHFLFSLSLLPLYLHQNSFC